MEHSKIDLNEDLFDLDFLSESVEEAEPSDGLVYFKILISDDESVIHDVTKMVLKNFEFEGKKLMFLDAYGEIGTKELMREHQDIAVVLQDVVMEKDDSGLQLVDYLRNDLANSTARIILRTGQPGKSPEEKVIADYDINDYKTKTELTAQKLFTTMYSCLRSYRDIVTIEKTKKGLERVIKASSNLFQSNTFNEFLTGMLQQLAGFHSENDSIVFKAEGGMPEGFIIRDSDIEPGTDYRILAATGKFEPYIGQCIDDIDDLAFVEGEMKSFDNDEIISIKTLPDRGYIAYQKGMMSNGSFIYMEGNPKDVDMGLIHIFLSNFAVAIDNFQIHQEMISSQNEIIYTLGEIIEKRSKETANHVRRISEICRLFAEKLALPDEKREELRIASTMHDIGKISTPDEILTKPGQLTDEEFVIMRNHAMEGFNILNHYPKGALKVAAIIARHHHEKYDGSGYPDGLAGEDIPLCARVVAIADVLDALTHERCYKPAWSFDEAVAYIEDNSGNHFDPGLVKIMQDSKEALLEIIKL